MQTITVDGEAQAAWTAEVRRFHVQVKLEVEDSAGQRHTLVEINRETASWQGFEGLGSTFLLSSKAATRWICGISPLALLHIRVDERGQLEVWSGSVAVAKHFDAEGSPGEVPPGLIHIEASKVVDLGTLLVCENASSLSSLDLGGANSLVDLKPIGRFFELKSLNLKGCSELTDIGPLAGLTQLSSLDLSGCKKIVDLDSLASLTHLKSLDLSKCQELRNISSLANLKQLTSLDLSKCHRLTDLGPLTSLMALYSLRISNCRKLVDVGPLGSLTKLRQLDLSGCELLAKLCTMSRPNQLTSLNLANCHAIDDLGPLAELTEITSLDISGCDSVSDFGPLSSLTQLTSLNMSMCEALIEVGALSTLTQLKSLDLSWCEALSDVSTLSTLTQLTTLDLSCCGSASDLCSLSSLTHLTSLDLSGCEAMTDIGPLSKLAQLTSLSLAGCTALTDLGPLSTLVNVPSLDLSNCIVLTDIGPLSSLTQLTSLNLSACTALSDLGPLSELTQLLSLELSGCEALRELGPLSNLTQLISLDLSACTALSNLEPLSNLTDLTSLNLSCCDALSELGPLAGMSQLASLNLAFCARLSLVAPIAGLPSLVKLDLSDCPNVRDADTLTDLPSIRDLDYNEASTRAIILLASAARRDDGDLADHTTSAAVVFELSKSVEVHACHLVRAVAALVKSGLNHATVFRAVVAAFRARSEVPLSIWEKLLTAIVQAPDPDLRPAFEAALFALPLAEAERVLAPVLLALADAPASARGWALDAAQHALRSVAASASHARAVAPAAAVFFHAQGLQEEVGLWLERGTVEQVPAWRDRVMLSLLGRELFLGEMLKARLILGEMKTPERKDEARRMFVQHLVKREEFSAASQELDAIVDRARRASAAADALASAPAFAGEPNAGLSLLLALDGDPDTLADVLAGMVQQAPDSELVRQIAVVFAPRAGVELGEAVDALLGHKAVADVTKPKELAALRGRVRASGKVARAALVRGMAALLAAEGLVDGDDAAEVTAELLEDAA